MVSNMAYLGAAAAMPGGGDAAACMYVSGILADLGSVDQFLTVRFTGGWSVRLYGDDPVTPPVNHNNNHPGTFLLTRAREIAKNPLTVWKCVNGHVTTQEVHTRTESDH